MTEVISSTFFLARRKVPSYCGKGKKQGGGVRIWALRMIASWLVEMGTGIRVQNRPSCIVVASLFCIEAFFSCTHVDSRIQCHQRMMKECRTVVEAAPMVDRRCAHVSHSSTTCSTIPDICCRCVMYMSCCCCTVADLK